MVDLDLITVGRVNLDLYAQQPGVEFTEVRGWDAMVGGSPTNVAIAATRLGLRAAAFTAVGADPVGNWVVQSLQRERVDTRFVALKRGPHTSLALRAQLPPDHELAFYRHDPADIHLTVAEARALPLPQTQALLVSADALARGSTREACRALIAAADATAGTTYFDLDLREVNWSGPDAYATTVDQVLDDVDVVLGTEEEFLALLRLESSSDESTAVQAVRSTFPRRAGQVIVVKQGDRGATALTESRVLRIDGYRVTEASSIGAGDSFAAGLIHSRLAGRDWSDACQFASACAAITVSRLGCSSGFPQRPEVDAFLETHTLTTNQVS